MSDQYPIRDQNDTYFLTWTTVEWIDIFTRKEYRIILTENLNYCVAHKGLIVNAWVIMSNHVHLIARAKEGYRMSDILRDYKKFTSKAIADAIHEVPESRSRWLIDLMAFNARKTGRADEFKLWQDGSHAMDCFSTSFTKQKLDYIHNNPVRAMWVDRPEEYLFSSARDYCGIKGLVNVELI